MNTKRTTKLLAFFLAVIMCALSLAACFKQPAGEQPTPDGPVVDERETKYLEAYEKLNQGEYVSAYELFVELGDYKDAAEEAARFRYVPVSCIGRYSGEGAMSNETTTVTLNENNLPAKCLILYDDGTQHTCTYFYNENGKLTSIFCTDPMGELEMFEAVYRADGKLEKETYRYFSGNSYITEYTYDDRGYQTKVVENYPDGGRTVSEYFYDDNGNVIKIEVESDGNVFSREYVYDSNNRRTKVIERDADGNLSWTDDYLYSEQGKLIKIICTENGEVTDSTEYTYDEKGRLLSDVYRDPADGYVHSNEYTYTADGRTEKLLVKMPGVFEDTQDLSHKLVYVPFEYTDDEWDNIVRMY